MLSNITGPHECTASSSCSQIIVSSARIHFDLKSRRRKYTSFCESLYDLKCLKKLILCECQMTTLIKIELTIQLAENIYEEISKLLTCMEQTGCRSHGLMISLSVLIHLLKCPCLTGCWWIRSSSLCDIFIKSGLVVTEHPSTDSGWDTEKLAVITSASKKIRINC